MLEAAAAIPVRTQGDLRTFQEEIQPAAQPVVLHEPYERDAK